MIKLWSNVSRQDIIKAIELFDKQHDSYPEPRNTFLLYNHKKYPAKHIRGLAYQIANKTEISKSEYNGGQETAIFFMQHGFTIDYKRATIKPTTNSKTPTKDKKSIAKRLNVVTQKNALQKLLQKYFGIIETEKKFDWLKTPDHNNLPKEYESVAINLLKYRNQNGFLKSHYQLLCDIVLDDRKLIFEYDENQHFTKARKITLENYPITIQLSFSKQSWIAACEKINAKDSSPMDRDEKRAYYDTVRDIEAFKHGYTLIRIKHGDIDWEAPEAYKHFDNLLAEQIIEGYEISSHKIARIVVTSKQYDRYGNPNFVRLESMIEKFISKVYNKKHFEFIITPGGFLSFDFPKNLQYEIDIAVAEEKQLPLFYSAAEKVISKFFKGLSKDNFKKLKATADYFTIGIDGLNPKNYNQRIELVAIYDLMNEKIIRWTGKSYATNEFQKRNLISIKDFNSHFIQVNGDSILVLGCHDLNIFSPRGNKIRKPDSWKGIIASEMKKLCKKYKPSIVLQHPHTTDTPNIWNNAWITLQQELPYVKHFASGIKFYNENGVRGDLKTVLAKTKKGDVLDFTYE